MEKLNSEYEFFVRTPCGILRLGGGNAVRSSRPAYYVGLACAGPAPRNNDTVNISVREATAVLPL